MVKTNREHQIKEERGLWEASSYVHKTAKRLLRKRLPIRVGYILNAHKILFSEINRNGMGGKYRPNNPSLKRIDGSSLTFPHYHDVPAKMTELDEELKFKTSKLRPPIKGKDYARIIKLAAKTSHRLACIHPFENGNGRASRMLINLILLRAGLYAIVVSENKKQYLNAMLQADKGDFFPLVLLITKGLIRFEKGVLKKQKSLLARKRTKKKIFLRRSNFEKV